MIYQIGICDDENSTCSELENILIMADVGVSMVMKIVSEIKTEVRIRNITDPREINDIIVDKMFVIYANESVMSTKINYSAEGLTVILMVGVNGAGKTTTIGKLAHRIVHDEGKKVVVAAGDTFRAGAIDQLAVWAERVGVDIVKGKEGGDPSAVVFDALNKAKETGADVLICDTAGRLQNKVNLMKELEKINEDNKSLLESLKESLKDKVVDVKVSNRLKSHPVCLVSDQGVSFEMEKVLNAMPDGQDVKAGRILEINPNHDIFKAIQNVYQNNADKINDYASLLFDQALLIEGLSIEDPVAFSNKICELMIELNK